MASLAGIALQMGYKVTGQDKQYYDPMKSLLNELGINEEISVEASKNLIQSDLVIIGNAISRGNPAAEYILNNRLKYSSGPAWLSKNVLKDKKSYSNSRNTW
jgi:UDP-N-acetylmuramate: L-alanyl-gamma-D-glutamyl-meso-diaminopimelate ligase